MGGGIIACDVGQNHLANEGIYGTESFDNTGTSSEAAKFLKNRDKFF